MTDNMIISMIIIIIIKAYLCAKIGMVVLGFTADVLSPPWPPCGSPPPSRASTPSCPRTRARSSARTRRWPCPCAPAG